MDNIFGIGAPELVVILIIAGIVMGPERIGHAARWLGKTSAQLQAISRGFLSQLNKELDGVDASGELRGAMSEVNDLRKELAQLRDEMLSTTKSSLDETQKILADTKADLERSIAPPAMQASLEKDGQPESQNGSAETPSASTQPPAVEPPNIPPVLPKRVEVADDSDV